MDQLIAGIHTLFEEASRITTGYLEQHEDSSLPVVRSLPPEVLKRHLDLRLPVEGRPTEELLDEMRRVLEYSVRTGHPRFLNQLFGGCDQAAVLGEWVTALINTSMYTYEAAPVATLMELEIIRRLNAKVGFHDGEGVFAPGGSISNLMAVLAARHVHFPHAKRKGLRPDDRPVMFMSEEAHYSLQRAASVAGFGIEGAVQVPTDGIGRMLPEELERAIQTVKTEGRKPFFVAATAGTTVPGAFDPIDSIADVAERHGMWLHVDGSYGATVLFSERHCHLLSGVERAHSVSWNPHKMMGVPLACAATLVREKGRLVAANGMNADYLFHDGQSAAWDLGDMTLQCGRRVDSLKLWMSWQVVGDRGYEERVDRLFDLADQFADMVREREGFQLVRQHQGTNVCFRFLRPAQRGLLGEERTKAEHEATITIRRRLVEEGRFLVNYATLDGAATWRLVCNNPRTTPDDLEALLDSIEALA